MIGAIAGMSSKMIGMFAGDLMIASMMGAGELNMNRNIAGGLSSSRM
jgi:hypothetical protein